MNKILVNICCMICSTFLWANNITVTNVSLENLNESEGWVHVQCDIFWNNSWRVNAGPSNWDAAWVFIKYRVNSGPWLHASINPAQTTINSAFTIDISDDNLGAFIYRRSNTILVYPNPAKDYISIKSSKQITSIDLYDVLGKKVLSFSMKSKIHVNNLPNGMYILKISTKGTQIMKTIIKH